jgi:hypothetical protein
MADTKVSDLTAIDAIASGDLFAVVDDPAGTPVSKKATIDQVKTFAVGAGSVSVASGKTLTANHSLTLAGTDSTTMTFPSTSATLARIDAANTFAGNQTFSGQAVGTLQTLSDGANIAWNCNSGAKAKVTLEGNRTMDAVTNAIEGTSYSLWIIQDGTGGRTITWTTSGAGSFDFGSEGAPVLTATASRADLLGFEAVSIGGTLKLRFAGIKKGFA